MKVNTEKRKTEGHGVKKYGGELVVLVNKTARRNYEITQVIEAGISLIGAEVKSLRTSQAQFNEAYIKIQAREAFLVGCHISPYSHARIEDYNPLANRKLLLHKREIKRLNDQIKQKGLTLIPLRFYFKQGLCKLELGLGKGKKLFDKRQDVKKRQADIAIRRAVKHQ